jgi:hypothetical protein
LAIVTPEGARFMAGCMELALASLAGDNERVMKALAFVRRFEQEVTQPLDDQGTINPDSPMASVFTVLARIGGYPWPSKQP